MIELNLGFCLVRSIAIMMQLLKSIANASNVLWALDNHH